MPRLRRLSGKEVIRIFQRFGFEVFSQRGSHIRLQRIVNGEEQRLLVAVHGNKPIPIGTLKSIYDDGCRFILEEELRPHFYTP
jgi:predicted RNA binding protein YcfA (HicA-like mRNA interferase family)